MASLNPPHILLWKYVHLICSLKSFFLEIKHCLTSLKKKHADISDSDQHFIFHGLEPVSWPSDLYLFWWFVCYIYLSCFCCQHLPSCFNCRQIFVLKLILHHWYYLIVLSRMRCNIENTCLYFSGTTTQFSSTLQ